ncbi:hypothetical protein MOR12E_12410 [Methylobacterium oryzae]
MVFVSSVAQHLPTPESAPYGMSKAGLGSLCRSLSRELAAGLPDARFVTLPDCAHVPQLQAPELFAREVLAFLRPGAA